MKAVHWSLMNTVPKSPNLPWETESRLIEILKTFKRYGANLNTKGDRGNTPLMDAAWWGLPCVIEFLIEEGANPDEKDNEGKAAVDYAKIRLAKNFSAEINASYQEVIQILTNAVKKS
jgi:ankyrin repeat protein